MGRQRIKLALSLSCGALLGWIASGSPVQGQLTVLQTDFVAAEGYADGELQFQSIVNGTTGTWFANFGGIVDTGGTGTVSRTANPGRALFQKGATGGTAGGDGSGETAGTGFSIGDLVRVEHVYSFSIPTAENIGLLQTGIRPDFVNGGFDSKPELGLNIDYINDGSGTLKVFSNMARSGSASTDDPFAFEIDALNIGIDNGSGGGTVDLQSDQLEFTWEAEYVGDDTWRTTEIIIQNLDTTFSASASTEKPASLESVVYGDSGVEAFFGMRQVQGFSGTGATDSVAFLYTPVSANLAGDFDMDGDIDGADLLRWQSDGLAIPDLLLWFTNYGGRSSGVRGVNPVPETATMTLCLNSLLLVSMLRCR